VSIEAEHTRGCLSNLSRIAVAFMQYAGDYDSKFPRGADAEDRYGEHRLMMPRADGTAIDARELPMLHELLFPYLRDRAVWHCPADVGWDQVHLPGVQSTLGNVRPSSFVRYGTSYYYLTKHGFEGWRAVDIDQPNLDAVLFDGDTWHKLDADGSLNVLFADGHVQNLTPSQFGALPQLPYDYGAVYSR
jgi:general secretion pathway protein G